MEAATFAGITETLKAPNWASLLDVTATNYDSRLKSNYYINFTSDNEIPMVTSKGAVFFDMPPQFELRNEPYNCFTTNEEYATFIECER